MYCSYILPKYLAKIEAYYDSDFLDFINIDPDNISQGLEDFETSLHLSGDEKTNLKKYLICENLDKNGFLKEINQQILTSPIYQGKHRLKFQEQHEINKENFNNVMNIRKYNKKCFYVIFDNNNIFSPWEYEILLEKAELLVIFYFFI